VVFLSALFGLGYQPASISIEPGVDRNTTSEYEWKGKVRNAMEERVGWEEKFKVEGLGKGMNIWKGVEVKDVPVWRFEKPLDGIWEGGKLSRQ